MAAPTESARPYARADFILTAAIALVCFLVLGLVAVLAAGTRVQEQFSERRMEMRTARNVAIAFSQAHADAAVAQRSYLLAREPSHLTQYGEAREEARLQLAEMYRVSASHPESLALVERIEELDAQHFAFLDAALPGGRRAGAPQTDPSQALTGAITNLHQEVIRRADRLRADEEGARRQLDSIAIALALLSLITSALAILALRRERAQWRMANEAAEAARAKAAASDLAKTRFLATASHDMRQPLHALTLYITALQRRVDTDEAREILAKMERAAHSMSGMFSTLLDLARIQAEVITPEIVSFPLAEVLERLAHEHPGARIRIPEPPTPIQLRTDPALLERLLRNLISNAIKHGGGDVRIEARREGDAAEIAVIDSGPGVKPEDQARIFEEFVRLDPRAGGEGLGLGLAIVKRIATLLDLKIDLRSTPGEGAAFIVRAPSSDGDKTAAGAAPPGAGNLAGLSVLAVDDDALALDAIAAMLRDLGAEVRACVNEASAFAALREGFAPRLVLMDLRLDGHLSGIDVAGRIGAALDPRPDVIVITGDTEPSTLAKLRASGYAWLIKPVNPQTLTQTLLGARTR